MKAIAVIVAAGKGLRMKSRLPKQYLLLQGEPVVRHTLKAFNMCNGVAKIILVVPESDISHCRKKIISGMDMKKPLQIVAGGLRRQDSVYQGLLAVDDEDSVIVIHDGVRPFVDSGMITRCIKGSAATGACIAAVPVQDTLKAVGSDGAVSATVERSRLWLAQTPQAFRYDVIIKAHLAAKKENHRATDDAALVERMGIKVNVVPGSRLNIKLTDPEDLELAEAILQVPPAAGLPV